MTSFSRRFLSICPVSDSITLFRSKRQNTRMSTIVISIAMNCHHSRVVIVSSSCDTQIISTSPLHAPSRSSESASACLRARCFQAFQTSSAASATPIHAWVWTCSVWFRVHSLWRPFGGMWAYSASASGFSSAEKRLGLGNDFQRLIAHWWRSLKRLSMSAHCISVSMRPLSRAF